MDAITSSVISSSLLRINSLNSSKDAGVFHLNPFFKYCQTCSMALDSGRDDQGNIQYLLCEKYVKVAADLFIDCSGFKSKLLGGILKEEFISFGERLFCDTAATSNVWRQFADGNSWLFGFLNIAHCT